jgi:hypothetical protein
MIIPLYQENNDRLGSLDERKLSFSNLDSEEEGVLKKVAFSTASLGTK